VDDYVTKPFSLEELGARIRAILSRTAAQRESEPILFQVADITIDMRRREATRGGEIIDLTPTEFRLLAALAKRAGQAVAREELVTEVWGSLRQGEGGALRRYIWLIRQKIERDPKRPKHLVTVRGFGYRLGD
jgi:two-component system KDP operon response regulator KdpE